jgi:hypothetical protein
MMTTSTTGWRGPTGGLAFTLALALGCAPMAVAGRVPGASCAVAEGGLATAVVAAADAVRRDDQLFRFLKRRYGAPSACRGSMQTAGGVGWVEFTWSDGAVFKTESMEPEIFIARYSRAQGLRDPAAIVAALRSYAAARGMPINWHAPQVERSARGRIEEFQDPDPGSNGIVRLMYSPAGVLTGLSLSSAP